MNDAQLLVGWPRLLARFIVCALLGVGLALTVRPARGDAPFGRYTLSADTVLDRRTGLTWQRVVPAGTYTQAAASTYCSTLSLSGSGWRLPTIGELLSIVDITRFSPSIDSGAFPNTPSVDFWNSTSYVDPSEAWSVNFLHGTSNIRAITIAYRVRCVR